MCHIGPCSSSNPDQHHKVQVGKLKYDHNRNLIAYTDGSKMGSLVGAGVFVEGNNKEITIPLGRYAEVYDAELMSIQKAAQYYKDWSAAYPRKRGRTMWIFTDNQATIQRVSTLKPGSGQQTALALARISKELATKEHRLMIQWVSGHTSVDGNEKADALAKLATEMTAP
jgi:ribonuclease HI